ncbi:MAG: NAD(P)H-binding protein, partial [Reyranella sp.]|nr:NAD(P)H-binding protein [Reyranella sp.]
MRILLTGANGFLGNQLMAGLRARGHEMVAAVRNPAAFRLKWPGVETLTVNFNRDTSSEAWRSRLAGVEAVINCAGVLHGGRGQDIEAIHATAPIALFDACAAAGVRRVVQVSAISADDEAGTEYALTKKRADDHLHGLQIDWTILRPSLVYGEGSYGGTSALRGLAGLPWASLLPGDGSAAFRPIHIDDLIETVARVVENDRFARQTLEPVGPEVVTLRDLVGKYRAWLGLAPARAIAIPMPLMRVAARIADFAGGGPLGTASLRQLEFGNAGKEPATAFAGKIGFTPRGMDEMLGRRPAQTQDLWHARLYFLRPLLRTALVLLWLGSALAGVLAPVASYVMVDAAFSSLGLPSRPLALAFSGAD